MAIVVGGFVGLVNGWLVAYRGLEPFIVTLGMLALARGLVYAYGEGIPIQPAAAADFAALGQTHAGRHPRAGDDLDPGGRADRLPADPDRLGPAGVCGGQQREAARSSGIPVRSTLLSVYVIAGMLVGIGGWMFISRFASGTALAGNLMELEAIAAVVIGGARLSGGYGKVFGAVMGTVIFQVIANLLSLLNVSTFLQDAFRGALILIAVHAGDDRVQEAAQGQDLADRSRLRSAQRRVARPVRESRCGIQSRPRRHARRVVPTALSAVLLMIMAGCGSIYPSKEPAAVRRTGSSPMCTR